MLIAHFPTSAWQSNCYLLALEAGSACVVVDPGPDALAGVEAAVAHHRLTPAGVVLTHGHLDHVMDAHLVCARWEVPAWLHPADREMLSSPMAGLGPQLAPMLAQLGLPLQLPEPAQVHDLVDGDTLRLAGLELSITLAPGHTKGSVLLTCAGDDAPLCLSGDVLFAGSVGRTDLPGGDPAELATTLRRMVQTLAPETVVLPGHGPATTMARELAGNPYLS